MGERTGIVAEERGQRGHSDSYERRHSDSFLNLLRVISGKCLLSVLFEVSQKRVDFGLGYLYSTHPHSSCCFRAQQLFLHA